MACSPSADDDDGGTDPAPTTPDRTASDRALFALAETALDGAEPVNGAVLEGECPVLGDLSVAELVGEAGIDLEIDDGEAGGTVFAAGEGFQWSCWTRRESASAEVVVLQAPAQDAAEYARLFDPFIAGSLDPDVEADGFDDGSLLAREDVDDGALLWVDDGLSISVNLVDGGDSLPREDNLAALAATRDAVLATIADAAGEDASSTAPAPRVDRGAVLDAFDERLEGLGSSREVLEVESCPFLDDEDVPNVTDEAAWPIEPVFERANASAPQHSLECTFGEAPDFRSVTVHLGRPRTVSELTALVESPIQGEDGTTTPLDTSDPELDGRAYVIERGSATTAGWIDNGLRIELFLQGEDDPEQALSAVVPAVLEDLGLS